MERDSLEEQIRKITNRTAERNKLARIDKDRQNGMDQAMEMKTNK